MSTASIPVDLLNPGQVFACIGLAEMALVLHGDARGAFDWRDRRNVRFHLATPAAENPVEAALAFLEKAEVVSVAPEGSPNRTEGWDIPTILQSSSDSFPNYEGQKSAQIPGRLRVGRVHLDIAYWGDSIEHCGRDGMKFWGGSQGKPGVKHVAEALASIRGKIVAASADPFNISALIGSSLRLEWRGSCIPVDVGFAPNNHKSDKSMRRVSYPLVEVLGAVGLSHARPLRLSREKYRYGVISAAKHGSESFLPLPLLRAAIGGSPLPFPQRVFTMNLGKASDHDRAITSSVEETSK